MNFTYTYLFLALSALICNIDLYTMDDSIASSSDSSLAQFNLSDSCDDICRDLVLTTLGSSSRETQDATAQTMKFEFSEELKPAFKFALMANHIYKAASFSKAQSHDAFLTSIKNMNLFKNLTIESVIEFASVVDKYMLDEGILAGVCHTIVEMTEGKELDLSACVLSPELIKCLVHYYYLLYKTQPMLKYAPDLRSAVRFSIRELINHKHIDLTKQDEYLIPVKCKTDRGSTVTMYKLDLSNEMINDIDGIEEFFKLIKPSLIIAINLSHNHLSNISVASLKECVNLQQINLENNLFATSPSAQIATLNPNIRTYLLGNTCQWISSPSNTRKNTHGKK